MSTETQNRPPTNSPDTRRNVPLPAPAVSPEQIASAVAALRGTSDAPAPLVGIPGAITESRPGIPNLSTAPHSEATRAVEKQRPAVDTEWNIGLAFTNKVERNIQEGAEAIKQHDLQEKLINVNTLRDRLAGRTYQWPVLGGVVRGIMHPSQTMRQMIDNSVAFQDRRYAAKLNRELHAVLGKDAPIGFALGVSQDTYAKLTDQGRADAQKRNAVTRAGSHVLDIARSATGIGQTSERKLALRYVRENQETVSHMLNISGSLAEQDAMGRRFAAIPRNEQGKEMELLDAKRFLGLKEDESLHKISSEKVNGILKPIIEAYAQAMHDHGQTELLMTDQENLVKAINEKIYSPEFMNLLPSDEQQQLRSRQLGTNSYSLVKRLVGKWDTYMVPGEDGKRKWDEVNLNGYAGKVDASPTGEINEGPGGWFARKHAEQLARKHFVVGGTGGVGRSGRTGVNFLNWAAMTAVDMAPYAGAIGLDAAMIGGRSILRKAVPILGVAGFAGIKEWRRTGSESRRTGVAVAEGADESTMSPELIETIASGAQASKIIEALTKSREAFRGEKNPEKAKALAWQLAQVEARRLQMKIGKRSELIRYTKGEVYQENTAIDANILQGKMALDGFYAGRTDNIFSNETYDTYVALAYTQLFESDATERNAQIKYLAKQRRKLAANGVNISDIEKVLSVGAADPELRVSSQERSLRLALANRRRLQARRGRRGAAMAAIGTFALSEGAGIVGAVTHPGDTLNNLAHTSFGDMGQNIQTGFSSAVAGVEQGGANLVQGVEHLPAMAANVTGEFGNFIQHPPTVTINGGEIAHQIQTPTPADVIGGMGQEFNNIVGSTGDFFTKLFSGDTSLSDIHNLNPLTWAALAVHDRFSPAHEVVIGNEHLMVSAGLHVIDAPGGHHFLVDTQAGNTTEYTGVTTDAHGQISLIDSNNHSHTLQELHITAGTEGVHEITLSGKYDHQSVVTPDGHTVTANLPSEAHLIPVRGHHGEYTLVIGKQTLATNVTFDAHGSAQFHEVEGIHVKISGEVHPGQTAPVDVFDKSGNPAEYWKENAHHIDGRSEDDVDYLKMYDWKADGDKVIIDVSHIDAAHQGQMGVYMTIPGHENEGIWVREDANGHIVLDPNDTHTHITAHMTMADLYKIVVNKSALGGFQGASEFNHQEGIFNLHGGRIETGWMQEVGGKTILHADSSIHGTGELQHSITVGGQTTYESKIAISGALLGNDIKLTGMNLEDRLPVDNSPLIPVMFWQEYKPGREEVPVEGRRVNGGSDGGTDTSRLTPLTVNNSVRATVPPVILRGTRPGDGGTTGENLSATATIDREAQELTAFQQLESNERNLTPGQRVILERKRLERQQQAAKETLQAEPAQAYFQKMEAILNELNTDLSALENTMPTRSFSKKWGMDRGQVLEYIQKYGMRIVLANLFIGVAAEHLVKKNDPAFSERLFTHLVAWENQFKGKNPNTATAEALLPSTYQPLPEAKTVSEELWAASPLDPLLERALNAVVSAEVIDRLGKTPDTKLTPEQAILVEAERVDGQKKLVAQAEIDQNKELPESDYFSHIQQLEEVFAKDWKDASEDEFKKLWGVEKTRMAYNMRLYGLRKILADRFAIDLIHTAFGDQVKDENLYKELMKRFVEYEVRYKGRLPESANKDVPLLDETNAGAVILGDAEGVSPIDKQMLPSAISVEMAEVLKDTPVGKELKELRDLQAQYPEDAKNLQRLLDELVTDLFAGAAQMSEDEFKKKWHAMRGEIQEKIKKIDMIALHGVDTSQIDAILNIRWAEEKILATP